MTEKDTDYTAEPSIGLPFQQAMDAMSAAGLTVDADSFPSGQFPLPDMKTILGMLKSIPEEQMKSLMAPVKRIVASELIRVLQNPDDDPVLLGMITKSAGYRPDQVNLVRESLNRNRSNYLELLQKHMAEKPEGGEGSGNGGVSRDEKLAKLRQAIKNRSHRTAQQPKNKYRDPIAMIDAQVEKLLCDRSLLINFLTSINATDAPGFHELVQNLLPRLMTEMRNTAIFKDGPPEIHISQEASEGKKEVEGKEEEEDVPALIRTDDRSNSTSDH